MPELELSEIQGFILRGYRAQSSAFLVLSVRDTRAARTALGRLVSGDERASPQITVASHWGDAKPKYWLNLGITWPGLRALGLDRVPDVSFKSFPSFVAGAAARADAVGDRGRSAPEHWLGRLGSGADHVVVALASTTSEELASALLALRRALIDTNAFEELLCFDAGALPGDTTHFGYRDGISQPTIEGVPGRTLADCQPRSPAWAFVLLEDDAAPYYLPTPHELGRNGSFGAFRILKQDVTAFENLLQSYNDQIDPELLAAKLMGRWRNGIPLVQSPLSDQSGLPEEDLNRFDYVSSSAAPGSVDDVRGLRCPVGAHIRRVNPRGQRVLGGGGHLHRVVRRGVPFGPAYQPGVQDSVDRGLVGFFINAQIENQFEFIMQAWVNEGGFAAGLAATSRDVIASSDTNASSFIEIPMPAPKPPLRVPTLGSFIQTLGAAYCFLPSVSAIRYLSQLRL